MTQNQQSDSSGPILAVIFGAIGICCVIELMATGGIALGFFNWFYSWRFLIGIGLFTVCLAGAFYGYKISAKDCDSPC